MNAKPGRWRSLFRRITPLKAALLYGLVGSLWILFSDSLLSLLVPDQGVHTALQWIKDSVFVLGTAVIVYVLFSSSVAAARRSEEALRENQRVATLMGNLPGMVYRSPGHEHSTIEFVSEGCLELTGYSPGDFTGNGPASYNQLIHPEDRALVREQIQAGLRERRPFTITYRIHTAAGEEKWVSEQGRGVFSPEGKLLDIEGLVIDATDRVRAEAQLVALIENLQMGIMVEDDSHVILYTNQEFCTLFGLDAAWQAIGKPSQEVVLASKHLFADAELFQNWVKTRPVARVASMGQEMVRTDGRILECSYVPMEMGEQLCRHLWLYTDITERKLLEAQFFQAQRMEAVGRLAGGVAHDFNNVLTSIKGYANLAKNALPKDSLVRKDVEQVIRSSDRAINVVKQLLAFSRRQAIAPKVVNLNGMILEMDKMLRHLIGEDIEMVTLTAPDLGLARVDVTQIEQSVVNLAVNARDAMPKGGVLTIETRNAFVDLDVVHRYPQLVPGEFVTLSVKDTGIGMDNQVKQHLFEPFFTTKELGKGTGLGLATTYGIVKQHQGYILVESEKGQGTTVTIYLPRVEGSDAELVRQEEAGALPQGDETILVVEDEPQVRVVTGRILQSLGYQVLEAAHGEEALRVAQEYKGQIDLLLTDVVMPHMNGNILAERMQKIRPGTKVLFVSGFVDEGILSQAGVRKGTGFLQKPFTDYALAGKVREVIGKSK